MTEWFFSSGNEFEFLRNLVTTLIALVLGIPFGLYLNRSWQSKQDEEQRNQLLCALVRVFEKNIAFLKQAQNLMNESLHTPSYLLDLVTLDATTHVRYQLITNLSMAEKIDLAHFELQHVNQRFEILQKINTDQGFTTHASFNPTVALLEQLKSYRETTGLASFVESKLDRMNGKSIITVRQLNLFKAMLETISLSVGLTSQSSDPLLEGGAVMHCRKAIDAIKQNLKQPIF